jgi:peptide/nickel transport system permease protein
VLATALGTVLAIAAGLNPHTLEHVIGRVSDVQLSVPGIVLALVVLSFFGNGYVPLVLVLVLGSWVLTYRIVADRVQAIAGSAFLEAARLTGATRWSVILRHVWPLVLPYVAVAFSLNFSAILVLESSLGFLGLGVQPPTPDWGQMIQTGLAKVATNWWLAVLPGVPLVATIVSVQILGDHVAAGRVQKGQRS